MEELAYVAGKIVKGIAGLAYAFGDTLMGLGPEGSGTSRKEKKDEGKANEER
ncbi:hypothetical protein [Streptomyces sp. NBC_00091]|uniref:hypothetical protein n=1 Tax=Streptomyces sp. NBC_00091 TaxID=2975648 RepID=UPI0022598329|nr:hypothetical protein [Streptomyces sp. NBC_00091]MCX5375653.1 hypothetical protein [Streptomyces sp. NBC_00091]